MSELTNPNAAGSQAKDESVLEAVLRRENRIIVASLIGMFVLSLAYLLILERAMASMESPSEWGALMGLMPMGRWGLSQYELAFAMWALMMFAMMIPSASPVILLQARIARQVEGSRLGLRSTSGFVAGYLFVWVLFSAFAAILQGMLVAVGLMTDFMTSASATLAGSILIAAGLYQWTKAKHACLAHCRSPISFFAQHWRPGPRGALRMGVVHGSYCVGCCWALMAALFAAGVMNLTWVAAIAALVLIEKTAPFGNWTERCAGALLVAMGVATLALSASS